MISDKSLIPTRPGLMGQLCRLQRRKLSHRHKALGQTKSDLNGDHVEAVSIVTPKNEIGARNGVEEELRELGRRLINAQEDERKRVARELHDDLNQRMAVLSIELEQLAQSIPIQQSNLRTSIQNLWTRAQEISAEIHRVSYGLHPSKLEHLGLSSAVNSLCEEMADHHEIEIHFRDGVSRNLKLPGDVKLCLYRIAQESLRNVIRHSGSGEAEVVLDWTDHLIRLTVTDHGVGFDTESITAWKGLGLISMKERLRGVGGDMTIRSNASGTTIEVLVPLPVESTSSDSNLQAWTGQAPDWSMSR